MDRAFRSVIARFGIELFADPARSLQKFIQILAGKHYPIDALLLLLHRAAVFVGQCAASVCAAASVSAVRIFFQAEYELSSASALSALTPSRSIRPAACSAIGAGLLAASLPFSTESSAATGSRCRLQHFSVRPLTALVDF